MSGLPERIERGFAAARQIADAVLPEGHVLHPYGAPAARSRLRWRSGVLVPPDYTAQGGEHSHQRTECLMEARAGDLLAVELRFLRVQRRTVEQATAAGFESVERLELADRALAEGEEGVAERVDIVVPVEELAGAGVQRPFRLPGVGETGLVHERGAVVGRVVRRREQVDGLLWLRAEEPAGPYRVQRLTAEVENTSAWRPPRWATRDQALPRSLVSAHLLLGLEHGRFLSVTDPPDWARPAVERCRNERTWPVLAGPDGGSGVVLSAPIALEDHPRTAPEGLGTPYDAAGTTPPGG
ncbi:hypothetical protein [Kitasatospora sp. NPDC018619]|uniref:hypothetical protein n=1 Tax=unclassified Kitasatospora TaxID=2633591 RepID=UPI0037919DAD